MTRQWRPYFGGRRALFIGLSTASIAVATVIGTVLIGSIPDGRTGQDSAQDRDSEDVQPTVQTDSVSGTGDVADVAVVWLHPTDGTKSLILGGSKDETDGGLHAWELDGATQLEFLPIGAVNSIDIRYNFPYNGDMIDLIGLTNRTENEVQFFTIDPDTRDVTPLGSHAIDSPGIYGFSLAHDDSTGTFYSIPNTEEGIVEQWELDADGATINARKTRTLDVGGQVEGAAVDDANGWMFISEEETGIWRYQLDPSSGASRVSVDSVSDNPDLVADVEGLTIYSESSGRGYLIASSQGNSRFVVYERDPPHSYLGSFAITGNSEADIDGVTATDGIFVTDRNVSGQFPNGVFVAHDGETSAGSTNYKLVPWEHIASALSLSTRIRTRVPRTRDDRGADHGGSGAGDQAMLSLPSVTTNSTRTTVWAVHLRAQHRG